MTSSDSRKSEHRGEPVEETACPSCGAETLSDARFCHACGAVLEEKPGGRTWSAGRLAGLGAAAGLVAAAVFVAVMYSEDDSAPSSAPPTPMFGGQSDLSQMTPREAADHLFNRIMMASEGGDRAGAMLLVPTAIQAYGDLAALDRDAHYHLGLIHGVAGDRDNVERQIAALRQGAPNHLLALVLEHGIAERSGDRAAVSRVLEAFATAYDAEIAMPRPEYQAHLNVIERFHVIATTQSAPSTVEPAGAGQ